MYCYYSSRLRFFSSVLTSSQKVWVKQKQQKPQPKKENSLEKLKKEIEPKNEKQDSYEYENTTRVANSLVKDQSPQDQLANLFNFSTSRKNLINEEETLRGYDTRTEGSYSDSSTEDDEATYSEKSSYPEPPVKAVQYKQAPDAALQAFRDSKEAFYQEFGEPNVIKMHKTVPNVSMKSGVVIKVEVSLTDELVLTNHCSINDPCCTGINSVYIRLRAKKEYDQFIS